MRKALISLIICIVVFSGINIAEGQYIEDCYNGKEVIKKSGTEELYCLDKNTASELEKRGWGTVGLFYNVSLEYYDNSHFMSGDTIYFLDFTMNPFYKDMKNQCVNSVTREPFVRSYFLTCTAKFSNGTEIPARLGIITLDDGTKVYPQHTEIKLPNGTIVPPYPVEFRFLHGSFNINPVFIETFFAKDEQKPKNYLYRFDTDNTCEAAWWDEYQKYVKRDVVKKMYYDDFITEFCVNDQRPNYDILINQTS